jgi:hypothetical protein
MVSSQTAVREDGLQVWSVAVDMFNTQPQTADKGWFFSIGVERVAKISFLGKRNQLGTKYHVGPAILTDFRKIRTRSVKHVAPLGEMRNVYKILVGKPESKWQIGRPTSR